MWFKKKIKVEEKTPEMKQEEWNKHLEVFKQNLNIHYKEQKEIIKHLKDIGCFQDAYVELITVAEAIEKVVRKRWIRDEYYEYALNDWESFFIEHDYNAGRKEYYPISNLQMDCLKVLAGDDLPINYKLLSDWYEVNSRAFDVDFETGKCSKNYHVGHIYYHKPTGIIVKCLFIPKETDKE